MEEKCCYPYETGTIVFIEDESKNYKMRMGYISSNTQRYGLIECDRIEDVFYKVWKEGTEDKVMDFFKEMSGSVNAEDIDLFFDTLKKKNLPELEVKNIGGKTVFEQYEEAKDDIFNVSVIGTMSSGKSTLINSILHAELFPSANKFSSPLTAFYGIFGKATTRTTIRISNNSKMDHYEAICYAQDNETIIYPKGAVDAEKMETYNADERVQHIYVEGNIPNLSSDRIRLCLEDTPGANHYRNENCKRLTKEVIRRINGIILYVMNATQFGFNDDEQLLRNISAEMKRAGKQADNRFVFLVNKCDELDEEKGETIGGVLSEITKYLRQFGIENPILIPTSARLALLIRKEQNREGLMRSEKRELYQIDDFIEEPCLHFEKYAMIPEKVRKIIREKSETDYSDDEERRYNTALLHTGVPVLEETIKNCMENLYLHHIKKIVNDMIPLIKGAVLKNEFRKSISLEKSQWEVVDEEKTGLISRDFFPENISIDVSRIFPVMVIATMSSGKSTLINALLGTEILPSKNKACTAKVYSILDDDSIETPQLYITDKTGETYVVKEQLKEVLNEANNEDSVQSIFISGQIKGVHNTDKALLLIDTPGPNNSLDRLHGSITEKTLEKMSGGLLLYLINATQMGITDDYRTLKGIRNHVQKNKDIKVLFIINKIDELDYEKESIEQLVCDVKAYVEKAGIQNFDIIPISALAANLFKKVLAGETLTRNQKRNFESTYDMFRTKDRRMISYAITEDTCNQREMIEVGGCEYRRSDLLAALENTGFTYLEKYIQTKQIQSTKRDRIKINLKRAKEKKND